VGGDDVASRGQRVDEGAQDVARVVVVADEVEDGDQQEAGRLGEVEGL
jgi:hypothetical protein